MSNDWHVMVILTPEDVARLEVIRDHEGNDLSESDESLLTRIIEAWEARSMPSTDPHEVERVEKWPEVELSRRAAGYPLYLKANSLPDDELQRYFPADHPAVLSPEEARLLVHLAKIHGISYSGADLRALIDRLSTYAEEN